MLLTFHALVIMRIFSGNENINPTPMSFFCFLRRTTKAKMIIMRPRGMSVWVLLITWRLRISPHPPPPKFIHPFGTQALYLNSSVKQNNIKQTEHTENTRNTAAEEPFARFRENGVFLV